MDARKCLELGVAGNPFLVWKGPNSQHSGEGTCFKKLERRILFFLNPTALQEFLSPPIISCNKKNMFNFFCIGFFVCVWHYPILKIIGVIESANYYQRLILF